MSYAILAFLFLALCHFVYESIIAPSLRLKLRFELFKLRDDLRTLKNEYGSDLDDRHFHYLQDSLNVLIRFLPRFEIGNLALAASQINNDPQLKKRMEARAKILDDCQIAQATNIRNKSIEIAARAVRVNGGAWGFYVVPIALTFAVYKSVNEKVRAIILVRGRCRKSVSQDGKSQISQLAPQSPQATMGGPWLLRPCISPRPRVSDARISFRVTDRR